MNMRLHDSSGIPDGCSHVRPDNGAGVTRPDDVRQSLAAPPLDGGIANSRDIAEEKFQDLADSLPQTVFEIDLDGNLTFVNRSGYSMWLATQEDVDRGINIFDWLAPEDHERVRQNMRRALAGEAEGAEYRALRKDGTVFPVVVHSRPIVRNGRPVGLGGIVIDMTDQKRAEFALRESEGHFRELADSLPETVFETDLEGRLLFLNRAGLDRSGYSREDLGSGPNALDILVPGAGSADIMRRTLDGEQTVMEHTAVRKDGTTFPVLARTTPILRRGVIVGTRGILIDLTERVQAEEARRRSESRFRSLVKHAIFGIYRSTVEGRFIEVNPALVTMLGYDTEEELLSVPVLALYHDPRDRRILLERFRYATRVAGIEAEWKRRDGTPLIVRLNGRWVSESEDGYPEGFEMIVEDVTDRRTLEAQFQQAQKMEAVGRLAGGIAHDFNNLLTAILGYADLLGEQIDEGDPKRQEVTEIMRAAERASSLTRQLLAFSRKQVLQLKSLDLTSVVLNIEPMLRRLIGEDIQLEISGGRKLARVKADPGQIEQVIMNLAVNARDAMQAGGTLSVETANVVLDEEYVASHDGVVPGPHVMLAVSDTGCGMTADVKAHLFEPFFTTKPREKGTGLGLATVYGIIRQSGGHVWVYSEVGRGTTFKVYFPRFEAPAEAVASAEPAAANVPRGSETVLLVEDDDAVRQLAEEVLRRQGYQVLVASCGEEGLQRAAGHAGPISLLVADVVMRQMSGPELASRLTLVRPDTRVLFVSGYADHAIVASGELRPDAAFLQKPFTRQAFTQAVREALDRGLPD